ncbi:LicD family protein [Butyrivibrio sp. MC2013]|uniref:LicD family protein n=1 Tax=Butyrivibrio sp. MC2013 TaxID=1280686 RepID=UPI000422FFD7|nr:LicD family protein [Butyrivibrio sp. MC2013]
MSFSFTEDYFKEEIRQDFTITSTMKRCWAAQMRVVSELEKLCDHYGIHYSAYWGTLLGAVREHGVIPWDDDIDIAMTRDDFNILVSHINELPDTLQLVGKDSSNFPFNGYYRIVNTNHVRWDDKYLAANYGFPMGAGVDVYVFDYIPRDEATLKWVGEFSDLCLNAADLILKDPRDPSLPQKLVNIQSFLGVNLDPASDKSIVWQLQTFYEAACSMTHEDEADEMALINHIFYHAPSIRFPKEALKEYIMLPFETGSIMAFKNHDIHLIKRFGKNYMTPKQQASQHNYPYYLGQLQMIADYCKENHTDEPVRKCNLEEEMKLRLGITSYY